MAEVDPRLGTVLDGRYRLDERLGAGGMGVVYRGERVGIGKTVAVKFLQDVAAALPELVRRFEREISAMSRLSHPHLTGVIDSGVSAGAPYLVMDYQLGRSLGEFIGDKGMAPGRAVGIARQILGGMAYAHRGGVVHRDLKPDNIMLLNDFDGDFVKILDFGLAKIVRGDGDDKSELTTSGLALGTPGYMSPEQAQGRNADQRSDLYSVGVILYLMVTGRKPFVAESPLAVLRMHMDQKPDPPRKVKPDCCSPELEKAILRSLEKAPSARFQNATEFARALETTPEGREASMPLIDLSMAAVDPSNPSLPSEKMPVPPTVAERPASKRRPRGRGVSRFLVILALASAIAVWLKLDPASARHLYQLVSSALSKSTEPPPPSGKTGKPAIKEAVPTPATNPSVKTSPFATPTPPPTPPPVAPPAAPMNTATPTPPAPIADDPGLIPSESEDAEDEIDDPLPTDTPGAQLEQAPLEPLPGKRGPTVADAAALLAADKVDAAMKTLYQVRRTSPRDPEVALLLGHAYFRKLWRTDGLREYGVALKLRPTLGRNPNLIRNTVAALDDPTYGHAHWLLRKRIGTAALEELRRVAKVGKNPKIQRRAALLATQIARRKGSTIRKP
jgi:serine/threonine-protein kinase